MCDGRTVQASALSNLTDGLAWFCDLSVSNGPALDVVRVDFHLTGDLLGKLRELNFMGLLFAFACSHDCREI